MKLSTQENSLAKIRDVSLILAAGATVLCTVFWIKRELDIEDLADSSAEEQEHLQSTVDRLVLSVESIDKRLQELATAMSTLDTVEPTPTASEIKPTTSRRRTSQRGASASGNSEASSKASENGSRPARSRRASRSTNPQNLESASSETQTNETQTNETQTETGDAA